MQTLSCKSFQAIMFDAQLVSIGLSSATLVVLFLILLTLWKVSKDGQ